MHGIRYAVGLALLWIPVAGANGSTSRQTACLSYEPDTVRLTGVLERLTFPGPPNFRSVAGGDAAETSLYLVLPEPVCTVGDTAFADAYPIRSADTVQLVLDSVASALLTPSIGRTITVAGNLFARHTGHHHAPLLLTPLEDEPSGR